VGMPAVRPETVERGEPGRLGTIMGTQQPDEDLETLHAPIVGIHPRAARDHERYGHRIDNQAISRERTDTLNS
jgi:hypothetical protein